MNKIINPPQTIPASSTFEAIETDVLKSTQLLGKFIGKISAWKGTVRVATTEYISLVGLPIVDDVQLNEGDFVLVRYQHNAVENGIYIASSIGDWKRSSLLADGSNAAGVACFVLEGTTGGSFINVNTIIIPEFSIVGTSHLYFIPLTGFGQGTALPGGSAYSIQYNEDQAFTGSDGFTYDETSTAVVPNMNCLGLTGYVNKGHNITYVNPTITVDSGGLITNISNGFGAQGINGAVQFNDNGTFSADDAFNYNNNVLTVNNIVTGHLTVQNSLNIPSIVAPGTYNNPVITVNSKGLVSNAVSSPGLNAGEVVFNNVGTIDTSNKILLQTNNVTAEFGSLAIKRSGVASLNSGSVIVPITVNTDKYAVFINSGSLLIVDTKGTTSFRVRSYLPNGSFDNTNNSTFEWVQIFGNFV